MCARTHTRKPYSVKVFGFHAKTERLTATTAAICTAPATTPPLPTSVSLPNERSIYLGPPFISIAAAAAAAAAAAGAGAGAAAAQQGAERSTKKVAQ